MGQDEGKKQGMSRYYGLASMRPKGRGKCCRSESQSKGLPHRGCQRRPKMEVWTDTWIMGTQSPERVPACPRSHSWLVSELEPEAILRMHFVMLSEAWWDPGTTRALCVHPQAPRGLRLGWSYFCHDCPAPHLSSPGAAEMSFSGCGAPCAPAQPSAH